MKKADLLDSKKKLFLKELASCAGIQKAAEKANIPYKTVLLLRLNDQKFADDITEALSQRALILEDEAIRRAVCGEEEPVFYAGELVGAKTKRSDTLLLSLLKANYPEKYGAKKPKTDIDIGKALDEAIEQLNKNNNENDPHEF